MWRDALNEKDTTRSLLKFASEFCSKIHKKLVSSGFPYGFLSPGNTFVCNFFPANFKMCRKFHVDFLAKKLNQQENSKEMSKFHANLNL